MLTPGRLCVVVVILQAQVCGEIKKYSRVVVVVKGKDDSNSIIQLICNLYIIKKMSSDKMKMINAFTYIHILRNQTNN